MPPLKAGTSLRSSRFSSPEGSLNADTTSSSETTSPSVQEISGFGGFWDTPSVQEFSRRSTSLETPRRSSYASFIVKSDPQLPDYSFTVPPSGIRRPSFTSQASPELSPTPHSYIDLTKSSPQTSLPCRKSGYTSIMVQDGEPSKSPLTPARFYETIPMRSPKPEFGKPTSIQAPQQNERYRDHQPYQSRPHNQPGNPKSSNVFNIPKPNQPRPEHHRPAPSLTQQAKDFGHKLVDTYITSKLAPHDTDFVQIARPTNPPTFTTRPAPQLFSSQPTSYRSFNHGGRGNWLNQATSGYNVFEDEYGSFDANVYTDAAKANENIKALLEGAIEDENDKPKTRLRKRKLESKLDDLAEKMKGMGVKDGSKQEQQDQVEEEEEDDGTVDGLQVKLLPHQIEGVRWMCDKEFGTKAKGTLPKGGILADDMGLGKTIQSLALILTNTKPSQSNLKDDNKTKLPADMHHGTLVVAPLALIKQWEAEIHDKVSKTHTMKVYVHHGPQRHQCASDLKKYDVVITTYQTLSSEHAHSGKELQVGCFGVNWYRVMLDEAHSIKNRNAKVTKAACALKAEYRWCLTGTPMQNNLDELQSLINFLQIQPYSSLPMWRQDITKPILAGNGELAIRRLQAFLMTFMKRRTKEILKKEGALNTGTGAGKDHSTAFQITKREVKPVEVEFTQSEREYYDRLEARADRSLEQMMAEAGSSKNISYASALVLLLRLRQACNSPTLVARSLGKDVDALQMGKNSSKLAMKEPKPTVDDGIDGIADMLGGLSVENKKCDVCQIKLTKQERSSRAVRCYECDDDLKNQLGKKAIKVKKAMLKPSRRTESEKPLRRRGENRRIVMDSDDEEDEGEWIVPKDKQLYPHLGRVGGSDDEDAEGGGEWLDSDDSDSDDSVKPKKQNEYEIAHDEEDEEVDEDSENESEDDFEDYAVLSQRVQSTKIQKLLEILNRESGKYKFIVFSQFTTMLDLVEPFLKREGLTFTRYDGSMRNDDREASLARLRNSPRTRILLCSLRCGSLGLNLTAASRVVIMEPFWNPFVEEQAIDRVHRLNQTQDVLVYKLTIKNTVEERILELQEKKRELANATIEGKAEVGKLRLKDLLALFHRDAEHGPRSHQGHDFSNNNKTRILNKPSGGGVAKDKPPVGRPEDSVYGRRW